MDSEGVRLLTLAGSLALLSVGALNVRDARFGRGPRIVGIIGLVLAAAAAIAGVTRL